MQVTKAAITRRATDVSEIVLRSNRTDALVILQRYGKVNIVPGQYSPQQREFRGTATAIALTLPTSQINALYNRRTKSWDYAILRQFVNKYLGEG